MTQLPRGAARFKWRRQRQQNARRWPTLNLVALMDVFTILVFFFLVHSSDSGPETYSKLLQLPESIANEQPRRTPVVTITRDSILLQSEPVIAVEAAMQAPRGAIAALHSALQAQRARDAAARVLVGAEGDAGSNVEEAAEGELTIMGDRSIPFALLNRVLHTCTEAGYGNISLSVRQRSTGPG